MHKVSRHYLQWISMSISWIILPQFYGKTNAKTKRDKVIMQCERLTHTIQTSFDDVNRLWIDGLRNEN